MPTYPKRQNHPVPEKQGSQHAVGNVITYYVTAGAAAVSGVREKAASGRG